MLGLSVWALEFDLSVDEEIRKNYNPSKLELEGLPPLPNIKPTNPAPQSNPTPQTVTKPQVPKNTLTPADKKPVITKIDKSTAIRLKKGTKFKVRSYQTISDSTREGTRISFVSQNPVTQRYVTIPQGTVFKGEIADSHTPQKTGNGGLIVLEIDSMVYKGSTIRLNAKITKVGKKKIFLNNIKGKRLYWKGVAKQIDKGEKFYKKTRRTSAKLADNPVGILVSPVPTVTGMALYAVNFVGSPFLALFSEGGRITIPAGTEFEIKLIEDAFL